MSKWQQLALGAFAAGATQFSILVGAGVVTPLPLAAGVLGAIGVGIAGMMKTLPKREWSDEERAEKLGTKP